MNKQPLRIAVVNVAINLGLTIFKLLAGIFGNSSALISEAIHSGADVLSAAIAMLGVKLAQNGPDEKHRYGHESFESIASIFLSIILLLAGVVIGYNAIIEIATSSYGSAPNIIALIAAIISALIKAIMCHALNIIAEKTGSPALKAEAWHLRTDIFSSIGCLLGIIGTRFGLYYLDPIAAVIVSLLILKVAFSIMHDGIGKITDQSCDRTTIHSMMTLIADNFDSVEILEFKTRIHGRSVDIDITLGIDGKLTIDTGEAVRHQMLSTLTKAFPQISNCTICLAPAIVDKAANRD